MTPGAARRHPEREPPPQAWASLVSILVGIQDQQPRLHARIGASAEAGSLIDNPDYHHGYAEVAGQAAPADDLPTTGSILPPVAATAPSGAGAGSQPDHHGQRRPGRDHPGSPPTDPRGAAGSNHSEPEPHPNHIPPLWSDHAVDSGDMLFSPPPRCALATRRLHLGTKRAASNACARPSPRHARCIRIGPSAPWRGRIDARYFPRCLVAHCRIRHALE